MDLQLSANFDSVGAHKLVEVDPQFAEELRRQAASSSAAMMDIKGSKQMAVLCTGDSTMGLRRVEYSNSLLVLRSSTNATNSCSEGPSSANGEQKSRHVVEERLSHLYECSRIRPRVEQVRELLLRAPLTIEELEGHAGRTRQAQEKAVTFEELLGEVCCSRSELVAFLKEEGAVVYGGKVRALAPTALSSCMAAIVAYLDGESADCSAAFDVELGGVAVSTLQNHFSGSFPDLVIRVVSHVFAAPVPGGGDERAVAFRKTAAAVAVAETLLCDAPEWTMRGDDFLDQWKARLPFATELVEVFGAPERAALNPQVLLEYALAGVAAVHTDGNRFELCTVEYLPQWSLPVTVAERVRKLFETTKGARWPHVGLQAYVSPLLEQGQSFSVGISKVCKEHIPMDKKGSPTYSLA